MSARKTLTLPVSVLRLFLPLILMTAAYSGDARSAILDCTVTRVLDGDTIDCSKTKGLYRIRLRSIDAPEKSQPWGKASGKNLRHHILGQKVRIDINGTDRYGRYLGTIYLRGININGVQVREGMAWAYRRYLDSQDYLRWEEQARSEKRGLWQDPRPVYPSDYRRQKRSAP
ncbi:thermonuclease family protein [Succinimonas amylolytica]|uniref:thermonuclease family protein n=1 Tax=Succinimonas amylolytica TaxID=83769 RepID=UPI0023A87F6A